MYPLYVKRYYVTMLEFGVIGTPTYRLISDKNNKNNLFD